uniref:Uncharacterized protein n=1 Tax=Anguilla anguilla TaxID=7936 RepID=A0A0E9R0K5_ANGAN
MFSREHSNGIFVTSHLSGLKPARHRRAWWAQPACVSGAVTRSATQLLRLGLG